MVCKPVGATPVGAASPALAQQGGRGAGRPAITAKRACCPPRGSRGAHRLPMTGSGCTRPLLPGGISVD
eukprot:361839-Chlamydomonas_euryale.AAC.8